jgi:SAM-dependent methyltransferase
MAGEITDSLEDRNSDTAEFWNREFAGAPATANAADSPLYRCFREMIGDVNGRDVLEIGCGRGDETVALAAAGARLLSVDISAVAVERARERLGQAGLTAELRVMDAFALPSLDRRFDLIVGQFILHRLEPFGAFSAILAARLKPGGRIVFLENNAANPLLLFARNHLAGRFFIPKYGDALEHPFTAAEVASLRRNFAAVVCQYPMLVCFRKLNSYLFRNKRIFRPITDFTARLDDALWRAVPGMRPWSYNQVICAAGPVRPA